MTFLDTFMSARNAATPLIFVTTPDQFATSRSISLAVSTVDGEPVPALARWDIQTGLIGLNDQGIDAISKAWAKFSKSLEDRGGEPVPLIASRNLALTLEAVQHLPGRVDDQQGNPQRMGSVVYILNAHRYLRDDLIVQAILNLRDKFKQDQRQLVGLGPMVQLPAELGDILLIDEPLPERPQLTSIITDVYSSAGLDEPKADVLERSVDAIQGLPAFRAEQAAAMSIRRAGINLDELWERKRKMVEQTPGLGIGRHKDRFKDVIGCDNAKAFYTEALSGPRPMKVLVWADEIEKQVAGVNSDVDSTARELFGELLTEMQDYEWTGSLFYGPPGAAKSAMAKAIGNEAGVLTVQFNLSAMKASLMGESNLNLRNALKVIRAVGGKDVTCVGTLNKVGVLPAEFLRRFSFGTFFYDLPTAAEQEGIWAMYLKKYGLNLKQKLPNYEGWTGSEIKNCCDIAYRLGRTVESAATFIVPFATSKPEQLAQLRREASGKYLSASKPGIYEAGANPEMVANHTQAKMLRKISVSEA